MLQRNNRVETISTSQTIPKLSMALTALEDQTADTTTTSFYYTQERTPPSFPTLPPHSALIYPPTYLPPHLRRGLDSFDMVGHQAGGQRGAVVDRVAVVVRLARAQLVAPLPEEVARHAVGGERERGLLPRLLDVAAGVGAVWLRSWLAFFLFSFFFFFFLFFIVERGTGRMGVVGVRDPFMGRAPYILPRDRACRRPYRRRRGS